MRRFNRSNFRSDSTSARTEHVRPFPSSNSTTPLAGADLIPCRILLVNSHKLHLHEIVIQTTVDPQAPVPTMCLRNTPQKFARDAYFGPEMMALMTATPSSLLPFFVVSNAILASSNSNRCVTSGFKSILPDRVVSSLICSHKLNNTYQQQRDQC